MGFDKKLIRDAWYNKLLEKDYSLIITINLPSTNMYGYYESRDRQETLERIRRLWRDIEREFIGFSHWERNPLPFTGVYSSIGLKKWSMDILVWKTEDDRSVVRKLEGVIERFRKEYLLSKGNISVEKVKVKEYTCGLLADKIYDSKEDYCVYDLKTLYGIKKMVYHIKKKEEDVDQ